MLKWMKVATIFALILLLASTMRSMVQITYSDSANDNIQNKNPLVQEANSLIEANQILIENRDLATFVAIGTVKKLKVYYWMRKREL